MIGTGDPLLDEIERRLSAWGQWVTQSTRGELGYGQSPLAAMMMKVARSEQGSRVPVLEVEASLTDDFIKALRGELRRVAVMHWGYNYTVRSIARAEHCSTRTAQNRIQDVISAMRIWINQGKPRHLFDSRNYID